MVSCRISLKPVQLDFRFYPLVNCYITMESHHFFHGFINYVYGHFHSNLLAYQRVYHIIIPLFTIENPFVIKNHKKTY